jgi:hypothetical protein
LHKCASLKGLRAIRTPSVFLATERLENCLRMMISKISIRCERARPNFSCGKWQSNDSEHLGEAKIKRLSRAAKNKTKGRRNSRRIRCFFARTTLREFSCRTVVPFSAVWLFGSGPCFELITHGGFRRCSGLAAGGRRSVNLPSPSPGIPSWPSSVGPDLAFRLCAAVARLE